MPAIPFSYRQYPGNGVTVTFSVPFPYLLKSHVKVYLGFNILDGTFGSELVDGTGYTWTSASQIQCTTPPASGQTLTVIRQTPNATRLVDWNDGSNLTAADLDTSDLQNLYVVQDQQDRNDAAVTLSQAAKTASETATSTANSALSNSSAAQATAASAVSTANAANTTSANALSVANTKGDAAIATANAASTSATNAVTTANAANATAASAVSTANAATASAAGAVTTANAADVKADAAIAAVSSSVNYTSIANVAAIPATPANNTYIEVQNTTGLESFSPLAGRPAGFVGDSGLKARLRYTTAGATWNWIDYSPTDAEGRYLKKAGGTMTGAITLAADPSQPLQPATKQYTDAAAATLQGNITSVNTTLQASIASVSATATSANTTANAALPKAGGTMSGAITFAAGQSFPGAVTSVSGTAPISVTGTTTPTVSVSAASTSASGVVQLSDSTSSTSSSTAATSAAVKSVQDFAQVVSTTANAAMPKAGGTFTGDVTFNTTTATVLPVGSTAQRPTGASGMIRFNTTVSQFEGFNGTVWSSVGGGATGGGADRVFQENDNTVTTNYTLSTNRNAVSAGPVTVNSGVTVTIPSGSAWVIV